MTPVFCVPSPTFLDTVGINTHIDFKNYGYENLPILSSVVNFMGVTHLRDSPQKPTTLSDWSRVRDQVSPNLKFCAYLPSASPDSVKRSLVLVAPLHAANLLDYLEGSNEPDGPYAVSQGNSGLLAAEFQRKVFEYGSSIGLPVINMSLGAGWASANGNYDKVGDLSPYCDFGNAHTYPNPQQKTSTIMERLNVLARMAAPNKPVITTEIGWDLRTKGFTEANVAERAILAALNGAYYGSKQTYFYSTFDDGSGKFGLMNVDGTPKPAGRAVANLIKAVGREPVLPGYAAVVCVGLTKNDRVLYLQKADGDVLVAVWNELDPAHVVTVNGPYAKFQIVDVFNGGAAEGNAGDVGNGRPLIVRLTPKAEGTSLTVQGNEQTVVMQSNMRSVNVFGNKNTIVAGVGLSKVMMGKAENRIYVGANPIEIGDSGQNNTVILQNPVSEVSMTGYVIDKGWRLDISKVKPAGATLDNLGKYAKVFNGPTYSTFVMGQVRVRLNGYAYLTLEKLKKNLILE